MCAINPEPEIELDPMHVSQLLDYEADSYGEPEKYDSLDEACQLPDPTIPTDANQLPDIQGPPTLQAELKELLQRYIGLLQAEVSKKPAVVPPMMLNVDEKRWTLPKHNKGRCRPQSQQKNAEIDRQVNLMIQMGVIRECRRERYSQVQLVPSSTIIFDKINNDVEVLTDLELHIVETLPRQIDCSIANADIARRAILVRIPKTQHSQQDQQVIDLFNNLSIDQLRHQHHNLDQKTRKICKGVHFMCVR